MLRATNLRGKSIPCYFRNIVFLIYMISRNNTTSWLTPQFSILHFFILTLCHDEWPAWQFSSV